MQSPPSDRGDRIPKSDLVTATPTESSDGSQQIKIVELDPVSKEMGEVAEGLTSSLYAMTVRLSLEVSTQVTKSSMCLERMSGDVRWSGNDVPCDEKGGISDCIGADADVTLFDELGGLG